MSISLAQLLDDQVVYSRTPAGQREVIFSDSLLEPPAQRLLLLVNGETPLRTLLDLLRLDGPNVGDAIVRLVDQGLIAARSEEAPAKPLARRHAP